MVSPRAVSVQEQYAASSVDVPFEALLAGPGVGGDDDALAELIEADGRARLTLGRDVELSRYLSAVPDLPERQVPLDAAIDVSLRWMSASSRPGPEAVRRMVERYPELESSIREAAALAHAMWSTSGLREKLEGPRRQVPSDFGPRTAGGRARFELRRLLGAGGWGEVYLAQDRQLSDDSHEALVAIKFLTGLRSGTWERQRLIDEAAKARRVDHANVARVLDRGVTEDDEDYLVYEYVSGGDLADWLDRQKAWPELRAAVALLAKIARGVQAAHAAGLVHCDLKPGNILLGADGEPRVSDFGIAVRSGEGAGEGVTGTDGRPAGNLAFIAPEQYRGEDGAFAVAADIYALGGLLFYLATRRLPNGSSVEEIRRTHALDGGRTEPPSLRKGLSWIDRDLDAVCRRAMAIRPGDRYPSAAAFADDLESWLRHEPVYWTKAGVLRRSVMWCRRSPILAVMLLLVLLTGGVGGIVSAHLSSVAQEQTKQAAEAKGAVAGTRDALRNALKSFQKMTAASGSVDVLPYAFMWEWANGPALLGDNPDGFTERWNARLQITNEMVAARRAAGGGDSIDALIWETTLAMFHLQFGEFERAEPMLASLIPRWRAAVTNQDDGFILWAEQLQSIGRSQRIAHTAASAPLSAEDRAAGAEILAELRVVLDAPAASDEWSVMQRMTLRAVRALSHASVLDIPAVYAEATRRIGKFPRQLRPELINPDLKNAKPKK